MINLTIRPAYSKWPEYRLFRDVVASLTDEELAIKPSPERWPEGGTIRIISARPATKRERHDYSEL